MLRWTSGGYVSDKADDDKLEELPPKAPTTDGPLRQFTWDRGEYVTAEELYQRRSGRKPHAVPSEAVALALEAIAEVKASGNLGASDPDQPEFQAIDLEAIAKRMAGGDDPEESGAVPIIAMSAVPQEEHEFPCHSSECEHPMCLLDQFRSIACSREEDHGGDLTKVLWEMLEHNDVVPRFTWAAWGLLRVRSVNAESVKEREDAKKILRKHYGSPEQQLPEEWAFLEIGSRGHEEERARGIVDMPKGVVVRLIFDDPDVPEGIKSGVMSAWANEIAEMGAHEQGDALIEDISGWGLRHRPESGVAGSLTVSVLCDMFREGDVLESLRPVSLAILRQAPILCPLPEDLSRAMDTLRAQPDVNAKVSPKWTTFELMEMVQMIQKEAAAPGAHPMENGTLSAIKRLFADTSGLLLGIKKGALAMMHDLMERVAPEGEKTTVLLPVLDGDSGVVMRELDGLPDDQMRAVAVFLSELEYNGTMQAIETAPDHLPQEPTE